MTLRGPGKIDGNVGAFLKMPDGLHPPTKLKIPWRPAQMVWFVESRNIAIHDIEIADAPYWSCFIYGCEDVAVERANIHTVRKLEGETSPRVIGTRNQRAAPRV